MRITSFAFSTLLILGCANPHVLDAPASGKRGGELLRTTTTWEGGTIAYPEGQPEVTSVVLEIAHGQTTAFHCHPVPTLGYIRRGTVRVETTAGKTIVLRQGDSAVEVMRTLHRGTALDGPVEIVVFYAGAVGVPNTVVPANDPQGHYCDANVDAN